MSQPIRAEALPDNPDEHYRIKPPFGNPRWYYLKKLRQLVEWGRDNFVRKELGKERIKLADYGCGTKPYVSIFADEKIEYLGIDLAWNPHAETIVGSDSVIQYPDSQIDVVLSAQVLEHVEDPEGYLREAHRILKPNGSFFSLPTVIGCTTPTDYWRWTSTGLRQIVERNGFEVVAFRILAVLMQG